MLGRNRYVAGVGWGISMRGWGYQDFTSALGNQIGSTSVTISANENGTLVSGFTGGNIISPTAVIVRLDTNGNPTAKKPRTAATLGLFSTIVTVSAHSGASVTLSGIPHSNYDCRIYYFYDYQYGAPTDYTIPSKAIAAGLFTELQDLMITEEELGDGSKDAVFNTLENTPIGTSTPAVGTFTTVTAEQITSSDDITASMTGVIQGGTIRCINFENVAGNKRFIWSIVEDSGEDYSIYPYVDNTHNLGGSGEIRYRWKDLWLAGNLTDGTNELTIANAKAAYDHISNNGSDHSYIDQDVATTASPSFVDGTFSGTGTFGGLILPADRDKIILGTSGGGQIYVEDIVFQPDMLRIVNTVEDADIYFTVNTGGVMNSVKYLGAEDRFDVHDFQAETAVINKTLTVHDSVVIYSNVFTLDGGFFSTLILESSLGAVDINVPDGNMVLIDDDVRLTLDDINAAYVHSTSNAQSHSDYLLNSGDDTMAGILTASGFISAGSVKIDDITISQSGDDLDFTRGTGNLFLDLRPSSAAGTARLTMHGHTIFDHVYAGNVKVLAGASAGLTFYESSASGETQEVKIYGYKDGDAKRSLEIGVGVDANDMASFDGVSNYAFDGNVRIGSVVAPTAGIILDVTGNASISGSIFNLANLPTADPSVSGELYTDSGFVRASL